MRGKSKSAMMQYEKTWSPSGTRCESARVRARGASEIACKIEIFRFSECEREPFTGEMSGSTTKMYTLRPIFDLPPCSPSKVMYKLPNILADKDDGSSHVEADIDAKMPDDVVTEQKPLRDYSALEARQEKVLDQLAKLKQHVQTLCHFLKQSERVDTLQIYAPLQELEKQVKLDLIVYANPWRPPYSILALQKLWKNTVFRLKSYIHSSVNGRVPVLFPSTPEPAVNNVINISLIWKKVETLEFVIDLSSSRIVSEVNLLRCLSRCTDEYNYEKTLKQHDDRILDSCYCLFVTEKLNGSVMNELEELEEIVSENSEILQGGLPRLPDIALWSTIRQLFPRNSQNKLPKSIKEVYRICEEMFIENDLVHV